MLPKAAALVVFIALAFTPTVCRHLTPTLTSRYPHCGVAPQDDLAQFSYQMDTYPHPFDFLSHLF